MLEKKPPLSKEVEFYLTKAEEMRELARRAPTAAIRSQFNEIADGYERLGRVSR